GGAICCLAPGAGVSALFVLVGCTDMGAAQLAPTTGLLAPTLGLWAAEQGGACPAAAGDHTTAGPGRHSTLTVFGRPGRRRWLLGAGRGWRALCRARHRRYREGLPGERGRDIRGHPYAVQFFSCPVADVAVRLL